MTTYPRILAGKAQAEESHPDKPEWEEARDSMAMLGWVLALAFVIYGALAVWLGAAAYLSIVGAMERGAAEASERGPM